MGKCLFHFDYSVSNGNYDPKNILETLEKLRKQINKNQIRSGEIQYSIEVDPGIPLYYKNDKQLTKNGDYFVVTIDRKTLYPKGFKNGEPYIVLKCKDKEKKEEKISLIATTYNGPCHLSDLLGILVAQQLRFNTFQLAMKEYEQIFYPLGTIQIFDILYKKYIGSYQNWQSGQVGKDVKILVSYQK